MKTYKVYICGICKQEYKQITQHLRKFHPAETTESYYLKYLSNCKKPTCAKPSCKNKVRFKGLLTGFAKYCSNSCRSSVTLTKMWKDPIFRKEQTGIIKARFKELWATERYIKLQSDASKRNWDNPEFRKKMRSGFSKSGWYISSKAGKVKFKSTYEKKAYELLDELSMVKTFIVEPFGVPYIFNDKKAKYYPDILVEYTDGIREVIEIKPGTFLKHELNLAKFLACKQYCSQNKLTFTVWTESQLFKSSFLFYDKIEDLFSQNSIVGS